MQNQELISFRLLSEIKKKQFGLQCENSMNLVEGCSKKYLCQATQAKFIHLFTTFKTHYSIAGTFLTSQLNGSNYNFDIFTKPTNKPIETENFIPSFDEIINNLLKSKGSGQVQIDFFTFSIFPSLYNFFFYSPRFDIDLLDELVKYLWSRDVDLFFQISRVFFVSPEFITYCHNVFQPIFSFIQNNFGEIKNNSLSNIKQFFLQVFEKEFYNHDFVQSPRFVVHVLLKSFDPFYTFKSSFIHFAFHSKETLIFYGLFHYSKPPSNELFKILKNIFVTNNVKDDLSFKIQDRFLNIILKVENYNDSFLKEPFNKPEGIKEYSKVFLTSNDISFFDSIQNHTEMKFHKSSELYICKEKNPNKEKNDIKIDDDDDDDISSGQFREINDVGDDYLYKMSFSTMPDEKQAMKPYLRHLLQYTDPIPDITEEMIKKTHLTFEKFMNDVLILRGPIESISKRRFYAFNLIQYLNLKLGKESNLEKILIPILDKIFIKDPKEIKLCEKFYQQSQLIQRIDNHNQKAFSSTKLIYSITNQLIQTKKIQFNHSNYIRYPLNLSKEFQSFIEKLKPFNFEYKNIFILLHLFDQDGLNNLYVSFIQKEANQNKSEVPDEKLFQSATIKSIYDEKIQNFASSLVVPPLKAYIEQLRIAFNEVSIFRMIELVKDTLDCILIKYDKANDPNEILHIKKVAIVLSMSPNLFIIYNFCKVYLSQFDQNNNDVNDILALFTDFYSSIRSAWEFNQNVIQKMKTENH